MAARLGMRKEHLSCRHREPLRGPRPAPPQGASARRECAWASVAVGSSSHGLSVHRAPGLENSTGSWVSRPAPPHRLSAGPAAADAPSFQKGRLGSGRALGFRALSIRRHLLGELTPPTALSTSCVRTRSPGSASSLDPLPLTKFRPEHTPPLTSPPGCLMGISSSVYPPNEPPSAAL